jgi:hypothetical protein
LFVVGAGCRVVMVTNLGARTTGSRPTGAPSTVTGAEVAALTGKERTSTSPACSSSPPPFKSH